MQVHSSVLPPSVVVGDSLIYAFQGDVFALDATDGTIQRRYAVRGVAEIAISDQTLYVAMNHLHEHMVQALRVDDGTLLWAYAVEAHLSGPPVVAGDVVYASVSTGQITALRAVDGASRWRYETGGSQLSSPVAAEGTVYVGASDGDVYALRAQDGSLIWHTFTSTSVTGASEVQIVSFSIGEPRARCAG
jgi:eukaryotic-like serine/threonine-protein kinase